MEIEGTIIIDLPLQEGVSKAGNPWKKKEWVLETAGMYPRRVKFHTFNTRVDNLPFELNKSYAITIEIESREFNGRWYTDVAAISARPLENPGGPAMAPANFGSQPAAGFAQPQQPAFGQAAPAAPAQDPFAGGDNSTDDLPF